MTRLELGPPRTLAVPDGRLAVWERGTGPVVVLVHGGTATAAHDWPALAVDLATDHRVVLFDQRGHGQSPDRGGELALRRFAGDLLHVLRGVGAGRACFVGFSMGANAVLHLLVRRPEVARGAVLVGGSAVGDPARILEPAGSEAWPGSLRRLRHAVDPAPDYWARLRDVLLADWAANPDVPEVALARADVPVLVVQGADDPVQRPEVGRHLAAALPSARLAVVDGAGHAVPRDQPAALATLVREFLDELPGQNR